MSLAISRYVVICATAAQSLLASGCSSATAEDELASVSQAFGSSSCGTVAANYSAIGAVDPLHTSPSSYNTCYRGYVVDVDNLSSSYTGPGLGGGQDAHIEVSWAGSVPTTQASCESAWGAAYFYKWVGGAWVDQTGRIDSYGVWHPPSGLAGWCDPPEIDTLGTVTMVAGESYRVAATMRTSYAGSSLRAIGVKNNKRQVIH